MGGTLRIVDKFGRAHYIREAMIVDIYFDADDSRGRIITLAAADFTNAAGQAHSIIVEGGEVDTLRSYVEAQRREGR